MSRSPRGARPYRRVIVVDTLVSSMNTSLLGSSLFCRRCNALRAAATSGRSCSAARKLFFKGQLQMMQKPRDRRLSDRDLFLRQSIFEFGQRDVRLLRYQLPHQILVRRQREIFIAAEFGRVDAARLPVKLEEADDRTDADPALLRGFRDRGPALDRLDHTPTQIRRIWLRHSCRPPPSRKLESYSRRYGNPRFSLSGKRSNFQFLDGDLKGFDMNAGRTGSSETVYFELTDLRLHKRDFRFGSRPCENSKVRSATRMIFLISISKLNALPMWAHETALNE